MDRIITVLTEQRARLVADAALVALLGGQHVYARDSVDLVEQIPGVYWSLPSVPAMEETSEPATIQWDVWAHDWDVLSAIEERLRAVLHRELPETWNNVRASSQFAGLASVPADDVGIVRLIAETQLQVARKRA